MKKPIFTVKPIITPEEQQLRELEISAKCLDKQIMRLTIQRNIVNLKVKKAATIIEINKEIEEMNKKLIDLESGKLFHK